jgi:hypothetical protein
MAVGDFWDVSTVPSNGTQPTPDAVPGEESPPADGKVRLALAKVLPSEAKHRGGGRRAGENKSAGIGLDELDDVDEALRRRNEILAAAIKRTQDLYIVTDQRQILRLAATDLFVEKAQLVLAQRARSMWRAGIVTTVAAVLLLIGLSAFLVWRAGSIASSSIAANLLVLGLVEMLSAALIVFVAVRYLTKLSRSFFHENASTVAKQLKDLQDAFGLDLESTPIFLDIKAKETADTIYSRVTQDLGVSPGR